MPLSYWVKALYTTSSLVIILPTKTLKLSTPYQAVFGSPPSYAHQWVYGCKCYPNLSVIATHNSLRAQLYVFFLAILLTTKDTAALTLCLIASSSCVMSYLMRLIFPLPSRLPLPTLQILSSSRIFLIPCRSP